MKNEWILDVLSDLRSFARLNELPELAECLNQTKAVAFTELTAGKGTCHDATGARNDIAPFGRSNNA